MAYNYNNPWLSTAVGNTQNPDQGYEEYLKSIGYNVDPSKVGKFFGGIDEEYQEDIGMARAGSAQGMQGLQTQGQQSAMQLGGGQGLASIGGGGFGRQSYGMKQGLGAIGQQYGQGLQGGLLGYTQDRMDAKRSKESQYRDIAAGLFSRDSEGISTEDRLSDLFGNYTYNQNRVPTTYSGDSIFIANEEWVWNYETQQYEQP